ncbi:50S ribosomal protein L22 [Patescibacteria group bacterium]|nr:50S ribosomal protein L22 [Patescibacteria group bacterium]
MPVTAKLRYLRIAPRKVRLVTNLIKGKRAEEAQTILGFTTKRAARPLIKLLKSAIASAVHNFQLEESNLYISKISVDEGPKLKRWRARARGRAEQIQKKTSHVTLILDEITKKPKKVKKMKKVKKVEKPEEKIPKPEKPKFRPEVEVPKPKIERGIRKVFRRKAF